MSGILDSKSRVLDVILTNEGRRQISRADLKIEYVSFTDGSTFYQTNTYDDSLNESTRIYLESRNLPQDQITFESDDTGLLKPFNNDKNIKVINGTILTGSNANLTPLTGTQFSSTSESLLASSYDNFTKLQIIGTKDSLFEDDGFATNVSSVQFDISKTGPINLVNSNSQIDKSIANFSLTAAESLFQDVRLSKLRNFMYLPPKIKGSGKNLGSYAPLGSNGTSNKLTPEMLELEFKKLSDIGMRRIVNFEPTSKVNNLMCQLFEIENGSMKKLDVIDYGTYNLGGAIKQVFFAGKIYIDANNNQTFVHLFTLLFG